MRVDVLRADQAHKTKKFKLRFFVNPSEVDSAGQLTLVELNNEVSTHSGINHNSIGVNHLPKTQSRVTKEIEQAPQLPEPQAINQPKLPPFAPLSFPNQLLDSQVNPSADAALIANPWLEIAKHSGLSVTPNADPIPSSEHPKGGLL